MTLNEIKYTIKGRTNSGLISCKSQNNLNFDMSALVSGFLWTVPGWQLVYKCTVKTSFCVHLVVCLFAKSRSVHYCARKFTYKRWSESKPKF